MLIGRSRRCDVTIRSPLVSRRHCRLESRDRGVFLRDLGSQNGTWIDGERIDHAFLQEGDRFVAGDVVLRVLTGGGVEEEGSTNPRQVRNSPKLREEGPALALILLPLLGGAALLILTTFGKSAFSGAGNPGDRGEAQVASGSNNTGALPGGPGSATDAPIGGDLAFASSSAQSSTTTANSETHAGGQEAPSTDAAVGPKGAADPQGYSLEDLLSIAAACDEEFSTREADMAALLTADEGGPLALKVTPPSLEESWEGIALDTERGRSNAPTFWNAPGADLRNPSRGGSPHTEVAVVSDYPEPAGPLFPETARNDIALAIVDEGLAMIDRYHVRDVSFIPLRPLITRLRDLDGIPAAHGLLALREHTHEHLGRVYRRVRKLEGEARKSGRDLAQGSGGAEAREDELSLRLAEMVKEHLETLVLIRDDLEGALAHEGRPVFLAEVLSAAVTLKEERLFSVGATAAAAFSRWEAVPFLIPGLKSSRVKIRNAARESLESITGETPGSSHRAWSEWWDLREGKESEQ